MKNNNILKLLIKSKKDINSLIMKNKVNDLYLIEEIEKILHKKRGYVFKIPKPGTPVIAFMSGGLDTTVTIYILMKVYKLKIFPLYINRNLPNTNSTKNAALFFQRFFKEKFGNQIEDIFEVNTKIPPPEFDDVVSFERKVIKRELRHGVPLQPAIYAEKAIFYSKFLELKRDIKIDTVIGAWLYSNSVFYGYESFTCLRSIMLNMCVLDDNFKLQFTSLPMERELGFYFDKDALIRAGEYFGIPLDRTWSCFLSKRRQCGACVSCSKRRESFGDVGVIDRTKYLTESPLFFDKRVVRKVNDLNDNDSL